MNHETCFFKRHVFFIILLFLQEVKKLIYTHGGFLFEHFTLYSRSTKRLNKIYT